ncbi:MAG: hypothetical protein ACLFTT_02270 [Candidatus Hydrogenedentota bacterium]
MTPRERVIRTLEFDTPDRPPRDLWVLPGVLMNQRNAYEQMLTRFPLDFAKPAHRYGPAKRARGTPAVVGACTDAWGNDVSAEQIAAVYETWQE